MKKIIGFLFLVLGGVIFSQPVFGQGVSIGISPVVFELTANPGDIIENQLKVSNPSETTIGIRMEVDDITPRGEEGFVTVEAAETETFSLARWVTTEPSEFELEPGEQKFVTFTINVPENAEPGGHYGSVLARSKSVAGAGVTGAVIAQRVGSLVLLSVAGDVKEELIIKDFSAPNYSEYGPITFTIRFENKGTVHVKPRGFVTITNWLDKKVADVEIPQNNVLPNAVRKIEASWNQKWLWAGKYTATISGSYGTENNVLTPVVITFWVFPWKASIGILLVLIFFILTRRRWSAAFRILIRGEK
jgi:hypothetical protein